MYILPKKYGNVKEVKIADVIRSMPLQSLGSDGHKMNPCPTSAMYTNLHFRFETYVVNPKTQKKIPVYKDIICNNGNLKELESIPCPIMKD
jgi:hypothetical protein